MTVYPPIRAVIFDWGGTLTPWHDIDLHSQWYAYSEIFDPVNASTMAAELAQAEVQRWRTQQESAGAISTGALESVFIERGIDTSSALHLRALSAYLDFWDPHTKADPDAIELLSSLREEGLLIGVLSNTMWPRRHHEEVFARDQLLHLIDAAAYTSEMAVAKPHSEAFLTIAGALGVEPEEAVFVGDRPWDDILGAQQVGMRTVWIPHSKIPVEQMPDDSAVPDAIAHRLGDVLGFVRDWRDGEQGR
jgi:putative hydrolase of the HAD superfamily